MHFRTLLLSFVVLFFFSISASAQNVLINGSFEAPVIGVMYDFVNANSAGWNTDQPDGNIEIWTSGAVLGGVFAQDGNQHIELNVDPDDPLTSIWQDIATEPGTESLWWDFWHRPRGTALEQVEVLMGPPGGPLVSQGIFDGIPGEWTQIGAEYIVPSGQNVTRFQIMKVTPGGGEGNLIDNVSVVRHEAIPTIGEWGLIILALGLMIVGLIAMQSRRVATRKASTL